MMRIIYWYIHTYIHSFIHTYYMYIGYTGLEMGGVASQNANHLWGNCESLWQSELQNCESLLADLRITFHMVSQKDLFFYPHPLFRQNFPFLDIWCIWCKNANTLRIMIRNCESLCQSVSPFYKNCESLFVS